MISKTKIKAKAKLKQPKLREMIRFLIKQPEEVWKEAAKLLSRPRSKQVKVNIEKLNKLTNEGDFVFVPGKVLGKGSMNHKLTLSAFSYSKSAASKLSKLGSQLLPLEEFINKTRSVKVKVKIVK